MTREQKRVETLNRMITDFKTLNSGTYIFSDGLTIYDYYDLKRVIAILKESGCANTALGNVIEWCKERGAHIAKSDSYYVITL